MADRPRRASANSNFGTATTSGHNYSNSGPPPSSSRPIIGGIHRQLRQSSVISFQNSLPSNLGFVTGPPSRAHWKPDTSVIFCESCSVRFNLITRRHHCRTCGGIFCGPCSKHIIRLDQNAEPHPAGVESRICEECQKEFSRRAERARMDAAALISRGGGSSGGGGVTVVGSQKPGVAPTAVRNPNQDDEEDEDQQSDEDDAVNELGTSAPIAGRGFRSDRRTSVDDIPIAQSVPSDWSWSTF
ncbi:hypothetical protein BDR26DRAFT_281809 [Obelidium mucronatum]|nr:hypothetical protein BDR26DRAFT_281809 [Obelidium mucronatum]